MPDERITWIDCPTCGDRAAVGWQIDRGPDGGLRRAPTTFDCTSGCTMTDLQVVHWFGGRGTGRTGARLG